MSKWQSLTQEMFSSLTWIFLCDKRDPDGAFQEMYINFRGWNVFLLLVVSQEIARHPFLNQSLQPFCGGRTDLETRVYWCLDIIGCCSPSWMCKEHREKLLSYSGVPNLCQSKPFWEYIFYYYFFLTYVMRIIIFRLCICISMCNNEYPVTVCYNYVVSALQGFRNRFFL